MSEIKPEIKAALPGTKRKQAAALAYNVKWMAEEFGADRIGFLTLTCGDETEDGFKKISSRRESSRRFNSLLSGVIRDRYQCGVVVTERHKDGGIHFHLVVAIGGDIRTGIDFDACFPARACVCKKIDRRKHIDACASECGRCGKTIPDYSTAPARLRMEWKFWRDEEQGGTGTAKAYGFGRCQMQPMKKDGEALGFYVAKYIGKDFENRHEDDRGGRCVRYFGRWRTQPQGERERWAHAPPKSARHGSLTAKARAWRGGLKFLAEHWSEKYGARFNFTQETAKDCFGPTWAFALTQWMRRSIWPEIGREDEREEWSRHNAEVRETYPHAASITEHSPAALCPTPPHVRELTRAQWEARRWSDAQRWRHLDQTAIDAARLWAENWNV